MADSDSDQFASADEDVEELVKPLSESFNKSSNQDDENSSNNGNSKTDPKQGDHLARLQPQPQQQQQIIQDNTIKTEQPNVGGGGGWSSWSSWGGALVSKASTLAAQVNQCVERALDAPPPEELAAEQTLKTEANVATIQQQPPPSDNNTTTSLGESQLNESNEANSSGSWWSGWTETGITIASSGLNVLETIGKKTMDVIQETDPGFQKTKSILKTPSSISLKQASLAQTLREAQQQQQQCDNNTALTGTETLDSQTNSPVISSNNAPSSIPPQLTTNDLLNELEKHKNDIQRRLEAQLGVLPRETMIRTRPTLQLIRQRVRHFMDFDFSEDKRPGLASISTTTTSLVDCDNESVDSTIDKNTEKNTLAALQRTIQIQKAANAIQTRKYRGEEIMNMDEAKCCGEQSSSSSSLQQLTETFGQRLNDLNHANILLYHQLLIVIINMRSTDVHDWKGFINGLFQLSELCLLDVKNMCAEYIKEMKSRRTENNRREISQQLTTVLVDEESACGLVKQAFNDLQPAVCFAFVSAAQ